MCSASLQLCSAACKESAYRLGGWVNSIACYSSVFNHLFLNQKQRRAADCAPHPTTHPHMPCRFPATVSLFGTAESPSGLSAPSQLAFNNTPHTGDDRYGLPLCRAHLPLGPALTAHILFSQSYRLPTASHENAPALRVLPHRIRSCCGSQASHAAAEAMPCLPASALATHCKARRVYDLNRSARGKPHRKATCSRTYEVEQVDSGSRKSPSCMRCPRLQLSSACVASRGGSHRACHHAEPYDHATQSVHMSVMSTHLAVRTPLLLNS